MRKILGFATAGSLIVIVPTILAQITAILLTNFPDSAFLWYADREIFRFVGICDHSWMLDPAAICFSVAIATAAFYAFCEGWCLVAGIISHACLFLAGKSFAMGVFAERYTSFPSVSRFFQESSFAFPLFGLSAAILSAAACYFLYLSTIARAPSGIRPPQV